MTNFGRIHFYSYKRPLDKLDLKVLLDRRPSRDVAFLYKIIHGAINSDLLCTVNFNVLARLNRSALTFYPHNQHTLSPITRNKSYLNNFWHTGFDIFCKYVNFTRQLNDIVCFIYTHKHL